MNEIIQTIQQRVNAHIEKHDINGALQYLSDQARLHPSVPEILYIMAKILKVLNKLDLAIITLNLIKPEIHGKFTLANQLLADLYEKRGMIDEAIKILQLECDNLSINEYSEMLQMMLKSPTVTSLDLLHAHKGWVRRFCNVPFYNRYTGFTPYDGKRRIRIGYQCSFWNTTTIKYQLLPLLKHHDRSKFEIFAYAPHNLEGHYKPYLDQIRVVTNLSDDMFIQVVRTDKIDILIECSGFSPGHRFKAMAARCAPVQISYLNHTGTSAVPNVDYVIADEMSLRRDEDRYFTERVYRIPGSFFCFNFEGDPHPVPTMPPHTKNGYITFGCFGSHGKINGTLLSWWAEILKRVPGSRLYVRNNELSPIENRNYLIKQMRSLGIEEDRLLVLGGADRDEIINCYAQVDISLDTWPYCGGNTVAESLWQGVPVISLRGQRFSSSYGASLLASSGCSELIASTPDEYVELAFRLAHDEKQLAYYRTNLRKLTKQHGFNDADTFARNIENAFRAMMNELYQSYQNDKSALEIISEAVSLDGLKSDTTFIKETWPLNFATRNFAPFNRFLVELGLKGLGVNNADNGAVSGENWLIEKLPTLLQTPNPVVFDVGAHIGDYSLQIAQKIPKAHIHLFEPLLLNYSKLVNNISGSNFRLNNFGLSDVARTSTIYNHSISDGDFCTMHASLLPDIFDRYYHTPTKGFDVSLKTVDDYCESNAITVIDFMKVDTEGYELKVFQGAKKMILQKAIRYIQFEFNYTSAFSHAFMDDFFAALPGYSFFRVLPQDLLPISEDDTPGINIFNYQNILAVEDSELDKVNLLLKENFQIKATAINNPEPQRVINNPLGKDLWSDVISKISKDGVLTIFDVGANEGQSSLEFIKIFPYATIYSFEPFTETYMLLKENVDSSRVKTFNLGFADSQGSRQFHASDLSCLNSILKQGSEWVWQSDPLKSSVELQFDTLDSFCLKQGIEYIDILKIDVQGAEEYVLKGAVRMLNEHRIGFVKLEVLFIELYEGQATFTSLYEMMLKYNFVFFGLYDHYYENGRLSWCDALFIHSNFFARK